MVIPARPGRPADFAGQRFVALTSYRRDGTGVRTPVWVVGHGDALLVWTGARTGKASRLRRDPRVDLAPCSRRGRVTPDAPHVAGQAVVSADAPLLQRAVQLLQAKYRLEYRIISAAERLFLRARAGERVVVYITPARSAR